MGLQVNGTSAERVNFNSQAVNYVVKDGKLVWADPRIYLHATGTQYLDTGIYGSNDTDYKIKWKNTRTSRTFASVFGSRASASQNRCSIILGNSSSADVAVYVNNYSNILGETELDYENQTPNSVREITKDNDLVTLNGVSKSFSSVPVYTTPNTLKLFAIDTAGTISLYLTGQIYYALFSQNSTLVRHLVPVPTGLQIGSFTVPSNGMFDIVNQQFYANQGTGNFTTGRDN